MIFKHCANDTKNDFQMQNNPQIRHCKFELAGCFKGVIEKHTKIVNLAMNRTTLQTSQVASAQLVKIFSMIRSLRRL